MVWIGCLKKLLRKNKNIILKTFFVKECNLYRNDEQEHDTEEVIRFCIGEIGADYVALDSDILSVSNHFYFSNDIVLKPKMFVAYRNISILKKIDNIINNLTEYRDAIASNDRVKLEALLEDGTKRKAICG